MALEDFPMDALLGAEVVVRFHLRNLFTREDMEGNSFEDMVRGLIEDEGLFGLAEDNPVILEIKVWQS